MCSKMLKYKYKVLSLPRFRANSYFLDFYSKKQLIHKL